MRDLIEAARYRKKVPQRYVAKKLHMSLSSYQRLITDEENMTPEDALQLSDILDCPTLTMVYCRKQCVIGHRYCYDVLNNVDLSPTAILTKYRMEEREAAEALEVLAELFLNKRDKGDCTEGELTQIGKWAQELLDLEHVIETLKLRLWDFLDVGQLVKEHNQKCFEKRYVDSRKPELSFEEAV
ncbi:helix-turn-helix domain-containing protein [Candidatus Contubernalis alkaliaceticus]|uniref:helix-turn-helix domain-containing protein n=1 Tax=Candidatus Contubernalis alkaliaceticus TaxID=338645 RepID=UPI001F4BDF87|nr:helix-turn-helix transcriptional regulator [Candidatus Contubernalis alkalaceticus]UNC91656.1 helix-turn-helix transcriptional regulator [Candidatus Contubernalis alkalaceticus]